MTDSPTLTQMIGMRVIATSKQGDHRLAGVMLPPLEGVPRIHLDVDATGTIGGEFLLLDPTAWIIALQKRLPERKKDRRRTRCPDGRVIYRPGDLPATQLATETMLRRIRRRRAEGQEPIASYMMFKGYAPLYAVADTVEMTPLSPARQAAWNAARTCARCGANCDHPFARSHDRRRYCEPCQEPAAEAWWNARRDADRATAAAWAAGVVSDPNVILLYDAATTPSSRLRVETLEGQVLLDADLHPDLDSCYHLKPEAFECFTDPAQAADQIRGLQGRRIIAWYGYLAVARRMRRIDPGILLQVADRFGDYYDGWVAERSPHGSPSYRYNPRLRQQHFPRDPTEHIALMRQVIIQMATGRADG